jgi:deazaflavin-dependent oxidoreductase (nitroreductase family)
MTAHRSDRIAGSLDEDLASWGKVITLITRGRTSGRPRRVALGFVEDADGSLLVAAADDLAEWALNLFADPGCHVERDGRSMACRAEPLDPAAHHATVAALILKYGTPAERQGGGPAFRLVPLDAQ